jgi:hypothetical protein
MRSLLLVLCLWAAPGGSQEIGWLKLDQAKALGSNTGKLILVYVACDPQTGSAPCSGGAAERSFADPAILKRKDEFHFVRVCDRKMAQSIRAAKPPEAIFLDSDGDEVFRAPFNDGNSLDRVMTGANAKYGPRTITWGAEVSTDPVGSPLIVVGFDDEKGEALKAFEDKTLAKYHDRIEFVRYSVKKDPDAAKKWGVNLGPIIFICDGTKDSPEKNTIEKLTGKKPPSALKASILKALAKVEQEARTKK